MPYRWPLLSELDDIDVGARADRFALTWDAASERHRYSEINVAAVVGLQSVLDEINSNIGSRVVANAAISAGTATKITFDANGLVTGGTNATTADIDDSLNRRYVTDAQLALLLNTSGTNTGDQDLSGYSEIGHGHTISDVTNLTSILSAKADLIDGVIPSSQLPALVKTDVFTVADEESMLVLDAQTGDVAIRTDLSKSFVHNGGETGTAADWSELVSPTDAVTSVNGLIGNITLGYADVGAAAAVHSHTIADVTGLQSALDGKAASSHTHTISQLTDLPTISATALANAIVKAGTGGKIVDDWLSANIPRLGASNAFTAPASFLPNGASVGPVIDLDTSGLNIRNTGGGGQKYTLASTNDTFAAGGTKFVITMNNSSSTQSFFTIIGPVNRIGFGQGNVNPQATVHGSGSTILGAAATAIADANIGNGQINLYLDETGHNLKIKVKYSNGTIRTATIALVA